MKAIETHYKGYRFRSRLEARWAVFFDALNIRFEYEKEGFDLDGLRYLPDYWLPDLHMWVEIKRRFDAESEEDSKEFEAELAKVRALSHESYAAALAMGAPGEMGLYVCGNAVSGDGGGWHEGVAQWAICGKCHHPTIRWNRSQPEWVGSANFQTPAGCGCFAEPCPASQHLMQEPYMTARAARFEHGEQG